MGAVILTARLHAEAKVIRNHILLNEDGNVFDARPLGWNEKGLIGSLQRLFTLKYFIFKDDAQVCEVRYDDLHDKFVISKDGKDWPFKIEDFTYGGRKFSFKTSLRKLEIIDTTDGAGAIVGKAKISLKSYTLDFESYPVELKPVIKEIAVLLIVKRMVWSMINPI